MTAGEDDAQIVDAELVADAPPATRFCARCGRPRTADACAACDARVAPTSADEAAHAAEDAHDARAVRSALTMYVALLGVSLAALLVVLSGPRPDDGLGPTGVFVVDVLFALVTIAWCLGRERKQVAAVTLRAPAGGTVRWVAFGALLALPTAAVAFVGNAFLARWLGVKELAYLEPFADLRFPFLAAVLSICVVPAVFEELAFRGVVLGALLRVMGAWEAAVVSALMFSILHLAPLGTPYLFAVGLLTAWLRLRTGSLWPCVALHFVHNLIALVAERTGGLGTWS